MLTKRRRIQLMAFTIIAAVSVAYAGFSYAGLDRVFGARGYVVTAVFADSGGIFVNAEVTYRGLAIGEVSDMRLADDGIKVDLHIESNSEIPADTHAVVANRSAVGEQYVDLQPENEEGPYLKDGSVIEPAKTSIPVAPETLLSNLSSLSSSVRPESLRTVVNETHDAFADAGPKLQKLLDSAMSFTETAQENLPQTKSLLADGQVVLNTQQRQAANINSLAGGFRQITSQLKESDPDLRKVIDEAPRLSSEISDLIARSGTDLGVVMANSLTTAQITSARTDALEELLVAFPVISSFTRSTSSNGEGHLGLAVNFFDPPACTKGYETTQQRPANDQSDANPNTEAYCAEPPGSPTTVRGAQNAPYAGEPVKVPAQPEPEQPPPPRRDGLPGVLAFTGGNSVTSSVGQLLGVPK